MNCCIAICCHWLWLCCSPHSVYSCMVPLIIPHQASSIDCQQSYIEYHALLSTLIVECCFLFWWIVIAWRVSWSCDKLLHCHMPPLIVAVLLTMQYLFLYSTINCSALSIQNLFLTIVYLMLHIAYHSCLECCFVFLSTVIAWGASWCLMHCCVVICHHQLCLCCSTHNFYSHMVLLIVWLCNVLLHCIVASVLTVLYFCHCILQMCLLVQCCIE